MNKELFNADDFLWNTTWYYSLRNMLFLPEAVYPSTNRPQFLQVASVLFNCNMNMYNESYLQSSIYPTLHYGNTIKSTPPVLLDTISPIGSNNSVDHPFQTSTPSGKITLNPADHTHPTSVVSQPGNWRPPHSLPADIQPTYT